MRFIFILFLLTAAGASAQVPFAHENALHKDSNIFVNWAVQATLKRGYQDASNISLGYTTVGDENSVAGKAGLNGLVSLGDGGEAVVLFEYPITNGPGPDFAVFENAFQVSGENTFFLELAFVEVSSDGHRYVRFPATCDIDTAVQIPNGVGSDPRLVKNLAGKYVTFYGAPFDLEELKDSAGLNVNSITHIKLIDVVGSISPAYGRRDSRGRIINDAWPTPFPSSGFDLEAVGVIHQNQVLGAKSVKPGRNGIRTIYSPGEKVELAGLPLQSEVIVSDLSGKLIFVQPVVSELLTIPAADLREGLYFLTVRSAAEINSYKIMIR